MGRYNVALIFSEDISEDIIKYASLLYKKIDSDVLLGENSTPHMTIGQFSVEENQAREIWEKYSGEIIKPTEITFSGLTILPSSKGGAWIEISVLKSSDLIKLQEKLITILKPYGDLINDTHDLYRPHVTVAHTSVGNEIELLPFFYKPLRFKSVQTRMGIGLGTNFESLNF